MQAGSLKETIEKLLLRPLKATKVSSWINLVTKEPKNLERLIVEVEKELR